MGGSNFDLIAHELLQQQRIMEEMEAENRWLRQELINLRAGRGLFLEIEGKRIPLVTSADSAPQILQAVEQAAPVLQPLLEEEISVRQRSTTVPLPDEEEQKIERASFLEEIMIDEFSAALTSPTAVWQGPVQKRETIKKPEQIDEEEMAALRRDLMGSFLLE
ncbi:MAG: hypothetical protein H0U76_09505 [Ktedonobacteraceae bacterium]|nr:hypothetical protein [Ktedonobacteraceae bacterium]